jgi:hypothetical protein
MPENPKSPRGEFLDDLLDASLRNYGRVEPLTGLEQRVLRRLDDEPKRSWLSGWHWSAMGAVGTLAVIALALVTYPPEVNRMVTPQKQVEHGASEQRSAPAPATVAPPPNRTPRYLQRTPKSGVRFGGASGVRPQALPPCEPEEQKDGKPKQTADEKQKPRNPQDCVPALPQQKRPERKNPPN